MPIKRVICPERIRTIPAHFSWVDHRLVRERYIERCDACAAALYLFLAWAFHCREVHEVYGIAMRRKPGDEGYAEG